MLNITKREAIFGLGGLLVGAAIGAAAHYHATKHDREELEKFRNDKEDLYEMMNDYKERLDDLDEFAKSVKKEYARAEEAEAAEEEFEDTVDYEDVVKEFDYASYDENHDQFVNSYRKSTKTAKQFCKEHGINPIFARVVDHYMNNSHEETVRDAYGYTNDMYPETITKEQYIYCEAANDPKEEEPAVLDCIIYPEDGIIMDTNTEKELDFVEGFISLYNLKEFGKYSDGYLFTYSYYFNTYCMCRLAGKGARYGKPERELPDDRPVEVLKEWEPKIIDSNEWLNLDGQEPVTLDYYQEDGIWADERGYVMATSWDPRVTFGDACYKEIMKIHIPAESVEYIYVRDLKSHTDYEICINGCSYDENDYIH